MDLERKTVLILGGSGLVGEAVARRLLPERPDRIVLVALYEEEVRLAAERLSALSGDTAVVYDWGNVFVPAPAARVSRSEMLEDDDLRRLVVADILDRISPEILERSFLYRLLVKHRGTPKPRGEPLHRSEWYLHFRRMAPATVHAKAGP